MCSVRIFTKTVNYTFNNIISRNYAFKSDLKIKWVRPEKICCCKPQKSGDLEGIIAIDPAKTILDFRESKELESANEDVKKLFSLKFAPRKETNQYVLHTLLGKVKQHEFDVDSLEVKIARWTGTIRALQEVFERFPRNKKMKVCLKELIDRRKKQLKYLRQWDYKKFEWLLENLNIVYKPSPGFHRVTRKDSLRKLTQIYCDDIKQERLDKYQLQLQNEQPAFLEEKARALQFIRDEQIECGVEVTVTQTEIDDVKNQLAELRRTTADNNN